MSTTALHAIDDEGALAFYRTVLHVLRDGGIQTLVGGTYALERHAGLARGTKDLDLFVRPRDWPRVVEVMKRAGFNAVLVFPHWLGKVYAGPRFVDFVFGGGNGVVRVDDEWFANAPEAEISGEHVRVCPPEEGIWSKAFIMERERFDGADVMHMLRQSGSTLDWERLLRRFGPHWRVLLAHLVLFAFVYPSECHIIPRWVLESLAMRLSDQQEPVNGQPVCFGTLLSRAQYLVDVSSWGFADARLAPHGNMTPEQVDLWTAAALDEMPDPTGIAIDARGEDANNASAA